MENTETLILSLSALCHDLGKLVQGSFEIPADYAENNQSLYQPVHTGRYSHKHALYTAAFIENNKELFPKILFHKDWGVDNFVNLAAMHHKPETPKQLIISIADQLSSGQDRDKFAEGEGVAFKDFQSTRLVPLLEQLLSFDKKSFVSLQNFECRYQLLPMSAKNIFPDKIQELTNKGLKDYQELYNNFLIGLKSLAHKEDNLILWMQHFESLWKKYTFFVPAARVGKVIPDVSLYHHSKTTAAMATALYLYHLKTDTLNEQEIKKNGNKFLIIAGDFFGIQKFIFAHAGEESHHRSKILRGRSFAISLFCELAADLLCYELELSPYSVLLNSAGKFYILAPNLEKATQKRVLKVEAKINDWLIANSYGETTLGLSFTEASPEDFKANNFTGFWQKVQENLASKKASQFDPARYCGVFNSYLDKFNNQLSSPLCPLCGKRPACADVENDPLIYSNTQGSACKWCRDHIMLGTNLVKNERIAILHKIDKSELASPGKYLVEPIFGEYQVVFVQGKMTNFAQNGTLRKLWQVDTTPEGEIPEEVTFVPLNGYVPVYTEDDQYDDRLVECKKDPQTTEELIEAIRERSPKLLAHLALSSLKNRDDKWWGVDALGVLKADVDDLGLLFSCGLPPERFTISRLYALSSTFNNFFALYLPYALRTNKEFNSTYTVFAGGDDLFLLGPWDKIINLAQFLAKKFKDYVCENPKIHFSAGISLVKANMPIDLIAKRTEENLEQAKDSGKNRITVFNRSLNWDCFNELFNLTTEFENLLTTNCLTKSTLYRLNDLIAMAEKEKLILKHLPKINLQDVDCLKWRALLCYIVARNVKAANEQTQQTKENIGLRLVELVQKHRGDLRVPLWTVLYKQRRYS